MYPLGEGVKEEDHHHQEAQEGTLAEALKVAREREVTAEFLAEYASVRG